MTPGEMALTRTPAGPNSAAHAFVKVSRAPLVELYRALGMPRRAIHEPRLMIAPLPAAAITGAIAPVRKYGALPLTPEPSSKGASSVVAVVVRGKTPALFTRTSMRPPRTRRTPAARSLDACRDPSRP